MIVREMNNEDRTAVLELLEAFCLENGTVNFNYQQSCEYLHQLAMAPDVGIFLAEHMGTPVGFAIVSHANEWHDERFGYIMKFYIHPDKRRSDAGRSLTRAICDWFDERGCDYSYCTSTAEIGQNKLYENLMQKFGYKICGQAMKREQYE